MSIDETAETWEAKKLRLRQLLRERAYREGPVVLASGKESDFYIDCKKVTLLAESHRLIKDLLLAMRNRSIPEFDLVGGVVLGGVPMASAIAAWTGFDAVYIRPKSKEHGTSQQVEGEVSQRRVLLLEDVVTTGQSCLDAWNAIMKKGGKVAGIIALVDRLEGAKETFDHYGIPFQSLFTKSDFVVT